MNTDRNRNPGRIRMQSILVTALIAAWLILPAYAADTEAEDPACSSVSSARQTEEQAEARDAGERQTEQQAKRHGRKAARVGELRPVRSRRLECHRRKVMTAQETRGLPCDS